METKNNTEIIIDEEEKVNNELKVDTEKEGEEQKLKESVDEKQDIYGENIEKIMEYLKPTLPPQVIEWINQGRTPAEVAALWQVQTLIDENQRLRKELEKNKLPIGSLCGSKSQDRQNPFVEGFIQALMQR